jgi:hypothetical protein
MCIIGVNGIMEMKLLLLLLLQLLVLVLVLVLVFDAASGYTVPCGFSCTLPDI